MITLTSIDRAPIRFNPDLIAAMSTIEKFANAGALIAVTALWCGGDEPFYVRESEAEIDRIIARDDGWLA